MGWVGLGPRIFDLPNVGLGTYFRQPNLPNNPLGQGNPSGQPYRTGTLFTHQLLTQAATLPTYSTTHSTRSFHRQYLLPYNYDLQRAYEAGLPIQKSLIHPR